MRSSVLLLTTGLTSVLAVPAPQYPAAGTTNGTLGLGEQCSSSAECANGANCYSTNSGLITRCGNFQASCSSNAQCAYNTCENGLCNGFIPSTTTSSSTYPTGTPVIVYLPLGADCNPDSTPCANGATCYATNSMLQPRCGNFQANCSNDSQCAFNTCQNGFCNGFIASTTTPASSYPATSTTSSAQPTSTSATSGLPLGADCDPKSDTCAGGAQCYATNYMLQPRCGNFQAECTTDAQCAFNKCNNGLCNAFLTTTSYPPFSAPYSSTSYAGSPSNTASATESSAQATYPASSEVVAPVPTTTSSMDSSAQATTAVSSETAIPQQSTIVVVTTPVVTENSVAVVTGSATRNPASSPTTSTPAQIITNAASTSNGSPLGLAIAGVLAIVAFA